MNFEALFDLLERKSWNRASPNLLQWQWEGKNVDILLQLSKNENDKALIFEFYFGMGGKTICFKDDTATFLYPVMDAINRDMSSPGALYLDAEDNLCYRYIWFSMNGGVAKGRMEEAVENLTSYLFDLLDAFFGVIDDVLEGNMTSAEAQMMLAPTEGSA